jgi:prevent-host-death family protein
MRLWTDEVKECACDSAIVVINIDWSYIMTILCIMPAAQTISATEFKAKCLDILERLRSRQLERVEITKRGRVVAVLTPPDSIPDAVRQVHGFMEGSVVIPEGFDLTAPVADEPFGPDAGELHG